MTENKEMVWRPIASANREDASAYLLWCGPHFEWQCGLYDDGWMTLDGTRLEGAMAPTHFMGLPSPPTEGEGE